MSRGATLLVFVAITLTGCGREDSSDERRVPQLTGLQLADAACAGQRAGLRLADRDGNLLVGDHGCRLNRHGTMLAHPDGPVAEQDPAPGVRVAPRSLIRVVTRCQEQAPFALCH